ncbi:hypothetical protein O6H91_09G077900 [Diphasiastrum complanatum]|uniref:Uncharacterized protein n=2 Tax=Diphasiastrum complanatum TaxID=34168 RepID=A0ACC2CR19_DIPCM|nr:hypothetical protein O6H91_09G055800 [Diphasiastrum complanatum]KAJ7544405.1 hypothetical protein O6H91_09G077900 [Diphasiastrum complanatum]
MSFAHQSWENRPGPTIGYKVAVHRPHYVGDGSNCRRQAQQQTPCYSLSSLNIAMHSPSDVSQQSKDAFTFRSQTTAGSIDKASVPRRKVNPHELCTQPQQIEDSKRCQAIGFGLSQSDSDGNATVAKSKEQRKSSLHVHFQIVPQKPNKHERRIADIEIANESPSSSSSSIGQGSDSSSCLTQKASEEQEVQSSLRSPLDHMNPLEDSLPIKRGLSRFFNGKSRSFTSLADVSSVNDLAKPENPYAKKRKWLHGRGRDNRIRIGHPPICHSLSGSSKKCLPSRDRGNQYLFSTGSGRDDTSEVSLAFAGLNGRQKRCAPPRSYSLSDLEGSGC